MKNKMFFTMLLTLPVLSLFSQVPSLDLPALKLDLILFDLPYQVEAAKTLEHGFFESYTHPSMETSLNITSGVYSAFHYGMNKFKNAAGLDTFWKRLIYYGGSITGDFLLFILPIPSSYLWMHESFHVAGFTHTGIQSRMGYAFPAGAYAISESGDFSYWYDFPRIVEAGIEGEYLLIKKMQRNNFFYEQDMFNEFLYLLANAQAWGYAYRPFQNDDLVMNVDGEEQEVTTDSLIWVYALFHPDEIVPDDRVIRMSDLDDNEKAFFKKRVMWALINFVSPMTFGIRSIPLGKDTGLYGNFALRQMYASFGTDVSVEVYLKKAPFNLALSFHNYLNYNHYFPAIEMELLDFPIKFNNFGLYLSPRVILGMQPQNMNFMTKDPEFFGLLGCRADFAISKYVLPYIDLSAKTDGWVAGNEFLEKNVSVKVGLSLRF
jgi:hypothetical protein